MPNASNNLARILIVDDELEIRSILSGILTQKWNCKTAGSAEEALTGILIRQTKAGRRFSLFPRREMIDAMNVVMYCLNHQGTAGQSK